MCLAVLTTTQQQHNNNTNNSNNNLFQEDTTISITFLFSRGSFSTVYLILVPKYFCPRGRGIERTQSESATDPVL